MSPDCSPPQESVHTGSLLHPMHSAPLPRGREVLLSRQCIPWYNAVREVTSLPPSPSHVEVNPPMNTVTSVRSVTKNLPKSISQYGNFSHMDHKTYVCNGAINCIYPFNW